MAGFEWDTNDLDNLLFYCGGIKDATAKAVMSRYRFRKTGRRNATALDIQHLMLMAVENEKAVVTRGFFVDEPDYAIRLAPQDKPFSDELFGEISLFTPDGNPFSFLPSKNCLIQTFPEIGNWSKVHDAVWKRDYTYWHCMSNALFMCQFKGGNIGKIPRCIDKKEFVLRLQWLICQYNALRIYLEHKPLYKVRNQINYGDGEPVEYVGESIEILFIDLLKAHASTRFAMAFASRSERELSARTEQNYLEDVRKAIKNGDDIDKGTPRANRYRSVQVNGLFNFKTELSKLYYFSSGTWFRELLKNLGDPAADEAFAEWAFVENLSNRYKNQKPPR